MKKNKEKLGAIRRKIDKTDIEIIKLINQRASLAKQTAQFKAQSVYDPKREKEVIKKISTNNCGPLKEADLENILKIQPHLLTIHLTGGSEMIKQVCSVKADTKIIGVTMLTSLDRNDLNACGVEIPESKFVENLTNLGFKSGIDGIVSSPLELTKLKKKFGNSMIYVTPGIRLNENKKNDQKRVSSPGQAVVNGSSLLVIGRPITSSPNPIKSIEEIIGNIRENIENRN